MISLYNTLTESKEFLEKSRGRKLKLFVCGPTVYDLPHLGHARVEVVFDVIVKYLRSVGYKIFYLGNITDVDDKIIERGVDPKVMEREYLKDMRALGISAIDRRARASVHIKEIIRQIKGLLDKGFAYTTKNGIYFSVRKFPDYGRLSKQNLNELRPGWRIEPDPEKKDPLDFALWKFVNSDTKKSRIHANDTNKYIWLSPWGAGRPGWHIEDTAITEKYFGPQYDLHGGGADLKFPHHESEIAQQESLSGKKPFVKIWLHVGLVMINNEKMAKSLRNFMEVRGFLKKYSANVLRFMLISSHYRSPVDFTEGLAGQAEAALGTVEGFVGKLDFIKNIKPKAENLNKIKISKNQKIQNYEQQFNEAMSDDFNTPEAMAVIFQLINDYQNKIWRLAKKDAKEIKKFIEIKLKLLGIEFKKEAVPARIKALVDKREKLRGEKQFDKADELRDRIEAMGYQVEDTPLGSLIQRG